MTEPRCSFRLPYQNSSVLESSLLSSPRVEFDTYSTADNPQMSTKTSPESWGPSPGQTSGSTSAPNGNGTPTPPNDVEMKSLRPDPPKGSIPLGEDIMQLARMGEIGTMQKLFTAKKFTANHRDEEGITPLHVCYSPAQRTTGICSLTTLSLSSGRQSTISMRCVDS